MRLILFCAEWCGSCREFKTHFDALEVKKLTKIWLDIEDHAALLEDIKISNLPTILAVSKDGLSFYFGEIPPKKVLLETILNNLSLGKIPQKSIPNNLQQLLHATEYIEK
jgi:thiol-disulfide isomerase/thioredoxin